MCGIAGVLKARGEPAWSRRPARWRPPSPIAVLTTRASTSTALGLAHRRLSILDLTPAGHQPMSQRGRDGLGRLQRPALRLRAARAAGSKDAATFPLPHGHRGPGPPVRGEGRDLLVDLRRHVRLRALGRAARAACSWRATASASSRCTTPRRDGSLAFASELRRCWPCLAAARASTTGRVVQLPLSVQRARRRAAIVRGMRKLPPGHRLIAARTAAPRASSATGRSPPDAATRRRRSRTSGRGARGAAGGRGAHAPRGRRAGGRVPERRPRLGGGHAGPPRRAAGPALQTFSVRFAEAPPRRGPRRAGGRRGRWAPIHHELVLGPGVAGRAARGRGGGATSRSRSPRPSRCTASPASPAST